MMIFKMQGFIMRLICSFRISSCKCADGTWLIDISDLIFASSLRKIVLRLILNFFLRNVLAKGSGDEKYYKIGIVLFAECA
jgi:hypothetical protein